MNYVSLINGFWKCDMEHHLTPNDTRLWLYLVHTCNSLGWKIPFSHSDRHLAIIVGMSVKSVRESKNRLFQRGLIEFKAPEKGSKGFEGQTKYWIIKDASFGGSPSTVLPGNTVRNTVHSTDCSTVHSTDCSTNNKLNKTKEKKVEKKESGSPSRTQVSFLFSDFLEMRKKIKKPTTPRAEELLLKKLENLSCGDDKLKIRIIEQSIEHSYQSFYPLKTVMKTKVEDSRTPKEAEFYVPRHFKKQP